jgi:hypothetical protein
MSFAGITERKWLGTFQTITSVADSKLIVADTYGFFVGQVITLTKVGLDAFEVKIRQVSSKTELIVGNPFMGFSHRYNQAELSPYVGGSATAYEQARPPIGDDIVFRAVYAEEPILALRNMLVDKYGNPIDSVLKTDGSNALAVDATISVVVPPLTVDLDALTPPTQSDPDNVLIAGSEDGTKTGIKHAVRVDADLVATTRLL